MMLAFVLVFFLHFSGIRAEDGWCMGKRVPTSCSCEMGVFTCTGQNIQTLPVANLSEGIYQIAMMNRRISTLPPEGSVNRKSDLLSSTVPYLQIINLGFNLITRLTNETFLGLRYLIKLQLPNNRIELIEPDAFLPLMYSLEVLNLERNLLEYLPRSIESLIHLKSLKLYGNPLHCSCSLRYFYDTLKYFETSSRQATCITPDQFRSTKLMELGRSDAINRLCTEEELLATSLGSNVRELQMKGPDPVQLPIGDEAWLHCDVIQEEFMEHDALQIWWTVPRDANQHLQFLHRNRSLHIVEGHAYHYGLYTCHAKLTVTLNKMTGNTKMKETRIIMGQRSTLISGREPQRPQIKQRPGDLEVQEGEKVVFKCSAEGYPTPTIQWVFQNGKHKVQLSNDGDVLVLSSELIILNATYTKSDGEYFCHVSNSRGGSKVRGVLRVISRKPSKPMDPMKPHEVPQSDLLAEATSNLTTTEELLQRAILRARKRVEDAIAKTAERLRQGPGSRGDIQTLFRQPNKAAIELSRAAEVYEAALEEISSILRQSSVNLQQQINSPTSQSSNLRSLLSEEQLAIISQLSGCQTNNEDTTCEDQLCFHLKYRSIDGRCNNLINPTQGAALTPFKRLLPPEYENGMTTPIGWNPDRLYFGFPKPSARDVSIRLISTFDDVQVDTKNSLLIMQWGQFLDHDLTFAPLDASNSRFSDGLACNETCVNDHPCFPILVSQSDPRVKRHCLGFTRSSATCGSGSTSILLGKPYHREQVNQITSYLDASNVYGSDAFEADLIRDTHQDNGRLKEGAPTASPHGRRLLPFVNEGIIDCQSDPNSPSVPCFKSGDHRTNENIGLATMHTMWMREHNRIVDELQRLNPHWSGDRLYYEARQIVGAEMQHITFNHWLPHIVGESGMRKLGEYRGYNDSVDASVSNSMATAAFRFGHTLINPIFLRLNSSYQSIPEGPVELPRAFFAPHLFFEAGGMDPIVRGLMWAGAKLVTPLQPMNFFLTEALFRFAHTVPQDLAALNIQRGRDHGLPSYNSYRRVCGLREYESFYDAPHWMAMPEKLAGLQSLYGHPGNVDLFVGGVLEPPVEGGKVGETFQCILIDQFRRTRDGDRFWYENRDSFTSAQLSQIRHVSLARIICDNSDNITHIPMGDVFLKPNYSIPLSSLVPCSSVPRVHLLPWKECPLSRNLGESPFIRRTAAEQSTDEKEKDVNPSDIQTDHLTNEIKKLKKALKEIEKRLKN